jgi:hypothetical protein
MATNEGKWDERLLCHVKRLSYDFSTHTGEMYFPAGNCCDMDGAVALFTAIAPGVHLIRTFAGTEPDTIFRRHRGQWKASLPG